MSLKLELPWIRELLSREEIQVAEVPSDSPAMATGEATVEFLSACCRLVDLLDNPQDIPFLTGLIQREIIYRILQSAEGARLRAIATLDHRSLNIDTFDSIYVLMGHALPEEAQSPSVQR